MRIEWPLASLGIVPVATSAVAIPAAMLKILLGSIACVDVTETMPNGPCEEMPIAIFMVPGSFTGSREKVAVAITGSPPMNWKPPAAVGVSFFRGSCMLARINVGTSPVRPVAVGSMHSIRILNSGRPEAPPTGSCLDTLVSISSWAPPAPVGTAK